MSPHEQSQETQLMGIYRRIWRAGAAAAALTLAASPAADASVVSVGVGGDTNWGIKVTATTNTSYPKVGTRLSGNTSIQYDAHFLGIPIPVTGYYISSFPYAPLARPTLVSDNVDLASTTYGYNWDGYMGKYAWTVYGQKGFWGDYTASISGSAVADTHRASGYFHAGTGSGHASDANARNLVSVP
jgi:hypothetical protein